MSDSSSEASSSSEEELNVDEDGRVALSGGSMDYSARGFDNAVFCGPNASTYEAFLADCSKVFTARATGGRGALCGLHVLDAGGREAFVGARATRAANLRLPHPRRAV